MNTELTLALKIVQDAGYKVTEPVKEPEKFVPVKGQIGYASDNVVGGTKYLTKFIEMQGTRYFCVCSNSDFDEINWDYFEPIPGLIQMEPYDSSYTGKANVLFEDGLINLFVNSQIASHRVWRYEHGKPVFFQKLGE